ncbi:hypothetical protein J4558_05130 [Leptolyngbya sp. 15MV]|nr:hypothetical protein J4558_05130 [Leptolyngbya sp. 15MV]
MPKRRPSMLAAWNAASLMPSTGTSSSSLAASSPGSPKHAMIAASKLPRCAASAASVAGPAISQSARLTISGRPKGAEAAVTVVPAEAAACAAAAIRAVTLSVVLLFTTSSRITVAPA